MLQLFKFFRTSVKISVMPTVPAVMTSSKRVGTQCVLSMNVKVFRGRRIKKSNEKKSKKNQKNLAFIHVCEPVDNEIFLLFLRDMAYLPQLLAVLVNC